MDIRRIPEERCIPIEKSYVTLYEYVCFRIGEMFVNFPFAELYKILPKYSFYKNESGDVCFCGQIKNFVKRRANHTILDKLHFTYVLCNITKQKIAIYNTNIYVDNDEMIKPEESLLQIFMANIAGEWSVYGYKRHKELYEKVIECILSLSNDKWFDLSSYSYMKIKKCHIINLEEVEIEGVEYRCDENTSQTRCYPLYIENLIDGKLDRLFITADDVKRKMLNNERKSIKQKIDNIINPIKEKIKYNQDEIARLTIEISEYQKELIEKQIETQKLYTELKSLRKDDYTIPE